MAEVEGSYSSEMRDEITVALVTGERDAYGVQTLGAEKIVRCRYEADAVRFIDDDGDGEVVRTGDVFATHVVLDGDDLQYGGWSRAVVWPPGVTPNGIANAKKISRVLRGEDLAGGELLFEVTL